MSPRPGHKLIDRHHFERSHPLVWFLLVMLVLSGCVDPGNETSDPAGPISLGEALYKTEGCVNCHGMEGQGVIAPRLNEGAVLETFPSCAGQLRWVALGSAGWARDVGATYGASNKPVLGGMPSFGRRLDPEQIRQVVSFTRTIFGGADPVEVAADCTS
jgi:mono/diheme cytochrome c family protein